MDFKAAILTKKVKVAPAAAAAAAAGPKEEPKEAPRTYKIPSYFTEDKHSYRVFSEEEADYLDRCSPSDKGRVITLLKSGKLRIDWDYDDDGDDAKPVRRPRATKVSRKGSVKA